MAYDDIHCPCGGKKLTGTMLCGACMDHFDQRPELSMFMDTTFSVSARRSAAIILLTLARKRRKIKTSCA